MVGTASTKRRLVATPNARRLVFETSSCARHPCAHDPPETGRPHRVKARGSAFWDHVLPMSYPCPTHVLTHVLTHGFEDGGRARISPVAPVGFRRVRFCDRERPPVRR